MTISRRAFLRGAGAALAAVVLPRRPLAAGPARGWDGSWAPDRPNGGLASTRAGRQAADGQAGPQGVSGAPTTMTGPMDGDRYRPVRRPPKVPPSPPLSADARDQVEHQLHCQCGCTLDVYTCRTTDFTCPVSPSMHQDVVALANGGYRGSEILAAFRATYGERVLMAPVREGFNWAAYIAPFLAVGAGGASLVVALRRWQRPAAPASAAPPAAPVPSATAEELARLDAAIRDDGP